MLVHTHTETGIVVAPASVIRCNKLYALNLKDLNLKDPVDPRMS